MSAPTLRQLRRAPLHTGGEDLNVAVDALIPHRAPFVFVDAVISCDRDRRTLLATSDVRADDPVFAGHFPGRPLLPAALQIEAIGQASLCLWAIAENDGRAPNHPLVVARVNGAEFMRPVRPGETMALHTALIETDDMLVEIAGQVYVAGALCAVCHLTVAILDE